jgi:hypothetical protein
MKDNFLRINSTPGTLDWFNDADWDAAISNIANIAWLAKESGFRGICFDSESYNDKQYRWKPEAGHSFEASYAMARRRGAQMMRAVVREYPDITFWSLWIFAQNRQNVADGTRAGLPSAQYGLWPAFLNGWLDALPPPHDWWKVMKTLITSKLMIDSPKSTTNYATRMVCCCKHCSNLKTASNIKLRSVSASASTSMHISMCGIPVSI